MEKQIFHLYVIIIFLIQKNMLLLFWICFFNYSKINMFVVQQLGKSIIKESDEIEHIEVKLQPAIS